MHVYERPYYKCYCCDKNTQARLGPIPSPSPNPMHFMHFLCNNCNTWNSSYNAFIPSRPEAQRGHCLAHWLCPRSQSCVIWGSSLNLSVPQDSHL